MEFASCTSFGNFSLSLWQANYFVTKCSVLIMSLFVFFTTTMSVTFILRETQSRMLKFTVQLQHHARHQLPTFQLIFVHVIESLVFVPIMIGILFFLFEFYDDQALAFLVLGLVWLCELFTMISVRTSISMQFFPRFFLLYFLVFHIYFFSYPYGFSYLAFLTTAAFMQHLIIYFWRHYEIFSLFVSQSFQWPALDRLMRRGSLQLQTGVQITSSTIVTSTLHIARVNVRNPETTGFPTPTDSPNSTGSPLQFPESDMRRTETAASSGFFNPFGSFLLSILGGAPSEGLVSFFSIFRDLRDSNQVYTDAPRHGNEAVM
ncbi:hypothetical protein Taro_029986 [Colocasia esculenta]|uniref:Uncharacterized protein n=1 Tax=Colocasia esculenta TaxID=4460 RepID=A0A843VLA3_COLES|nr:hypothetical protein [Colocasia esculenta]